MDIENNDKTYNGPQKGYINLLPKKEENFEGIEFRLGKKIEFYSDPYNNLYFWVNQKWIVVK